MRVKAAHNISLLVEKIVFIDASQRLLKKSIRADGSARAHLHSGQSESF